MVHLFTFSVLIIVLPVKCLVDAHNYIKGFSKLTHVPREIPSNSTKIYLNNNDIENIESETFAENSQCASLRLNQNRLTIIRKDMWTGLVALEYLSLEHNVIETVEPSSFAELHNLKGLYLHNNKLTYLPDNILPLKEMPKIEIMTLHDNKLSGMNWVGCVSFVTGDRYKSTPYEGMIYCVMTSVRMPTRGETLQSASVKCRNNSSNTYHLRVTYTVSKYLSWNTAHKVNKTLSDKIYIDWNCVTAQNTEFKIDIPDEVRENLFKVCDPPKLYCHFKST